MRTGIPYEELAYEAQTHDLIVLGRETHFHFETQSTSDETLSQLLKHVPRPVVAVPETAPPANGKVMVAYDGSLQAARTLQLFVATGLAKAVTKEPIHVVSVADPTKASEQADQAVSYLRLHGLAARAHAVQANGGVGETLLQVAGELPASLIVMGAYGQSALRDFLFGSVTKSVINRSTVPLFLYH
jgi:nucleotide-binding universal stress UspA family protein